ncbi:MAG TPA: hypothetical protein VN612_10460 [Acidobacteriaceae bacterium]|nr:hypothetical protein [Acidobacteriaceae bacterium]
MSAARTPTRITARADLVPGILYCLFVTDDDGSDRDGALVYWTGECFMDESGDERYDDWDFCVAQTVRVNPEFVVRT